ncbi:YJL132W-like protein [Saccharomyces cerevisiae x Saccharomyces kudriavzevii VIN7]|uniref:YJL132W-like protein n=1 Tax=Saccharomyces cerevisiae x Saccharomyces kudriavzevii (strain VIN7) TaxID=1095631 RepID=H0GWP2_SACCK|nr:YJL132W-like protein [Saccharomyces cerevisiae x Saccharomyces kudriavzevii VIN7]
MSIISSWLLVFIVCLSTSVVTKLQAAGVTTHLFYLTRGAPLTLKEGYYPWLKAGSFFPDALYSCAPSNKDWSDFAEFTHWPNFLVIALSYWQQKYGQKDQLRQSRDSLRLKSFLIGVFTHQIVDVSWHSLVTDYRMHGLLRVLSETEFDADIETAHTFLDVMGEFVTLNNVIRDSANNENWDFFARSDWKLPNEQDIMEIIRRAGLSKDRLSYAELEFCVKRGLAAAVSESYLFRSQRSQLLNNIYSTSPRANDLILNHWLGGESNLVAMLQKCVPFFESLFDGKAANEIEVEELRLCANLPPASNHNLETKSLKSPIKVQREDGHIVVSPMKSFSKFGTSFTLGKFQGNDEDYLAVSAPLEDTVGAIYLVPWDIFSISDKKDVSILQPMTAMYGSKVDTYSVGGVDYLAVSEPGTCRVHFYFKGTKVLTIEDTTTEEANQLQIALTEDFDGDQIPDLIVSSISYGINETGIVMFIPGSSIISYLINTNEYHFVDISTLKGIVSLDGYSDKIPFQHFGATIQMSNTLNKQKMIYITCQSLGTVFVYLSDDLQDPSIPKFHITEDRVVAAKDIDHAKLGIVSSKEHGMFGSAIHSWHFGGNDFVAISQPMFDTVFIYIEDSGQVRFSLKLILRINAKLGVVPNEFGTSLVFNEKEKELYISSPGSFDKRGSIWKIGMNELIKATNGSKRKSLVINNSKYLVLTNPDKDSKGLTDFGKTMTLGPENRLVVGIPQYGYGNFNHMQLTGRILVL